MNLPFLRRRIRAWSLRPLGRCVGLFLLCALLTAGIPLGKIHAHVGGDHDHSYSAADVLEAAWLADHADAPQGSTGDKVLHAHDSATATAALLLLASGMAMPVFGLQRWTAPPGNPPPRPAIRPPYRPPIA